MMSMLTHLSAPGARARCSMTQQLARRAGIGIRTVPRIERVKEENVYLVQGACLRTCFLTGENGRWAGEK